MSGWEGLDVYEEDVGHEPLKYGDYIYLTALKQDSPNLDGFLWAEGQVFKRVGLQMLSGGLLQTLTWSNEHFKARVPPLSW